MISLSSVKIPLNVCLSVLTMPSVMETSWSGRHLEDLTPCYLRLPTSRHSVDSHDVRQGKTESILLHSVEAQYGDQKIQLGEGSGKLAGRLVILQAWAIMLEKYTGQQQSCFGYSFRDSGISSHIIRGAERQDSVTVKDSLEQILHQLGFDPVGFSPRDLLSALESRSVSPFNTAISITNGTSLGRLDQQPDHQWIPGVRILAHLIKHHVF